MKEEKQNKDMGPAEKRPAEQEVRPAEQESPGKAEKEKRTREGRMAADRTEWRRAENRRLRLLAYLLLALALAGEALVRLWPAAADAYGSYAYPVLVSCLARLANLVPFSLVEVGLYAVLSFFLAALLRRVPFSCLLSVCIFFVGILSLTYVWNCGINYYRTPFSAYLQLEVRERDREELLDLVEYLTERVNETAHALEEESSWRQTGQKAMERLGETYPQLSGYYPLPKPLLISRILSVQQLCGVYSPFTIEANYNREMPPYNIPHTICHELSHLRGFMREDEANFIGYLGCIGSGDPDYIYSGYLTGWVYAGNALAGQDREAYRRLYESLSAQARADLAYNNAFWESFEGKAAEVQEKMNDTYLKINAQEDGVKSYGRMVDLMLAYYASDL